MTPYYDPRDVPAHGEASATVLLMNEAPGPLEAESGIPSFGPQGGNIYRALRRAQVQWATSAPSFAWPQKRPKGQSAQELIRHGFKADFLRERACHMTCTNAYSHWPKSSPEANDFRPPREFDVLSEENLLRIRREVRPNHGVLLVCGTYAYLACTGTTLLQSSKRELSLLDSVELQRVNDRLQSRFQTGWYMGHTRRWSLHAQDTTSALRSVANDVAWVLVDAD